MSLHVVILAVGVGQRFTRAGYSQHKSLLRMTDDTIIERLRKRFCQADKITVVCADPTNEQIFSKIFGSEHVARIPSHQLGPSQSLFLMGNLIGDWEEVLVTYCDYDLQVDLSHFLAHRKSSSFQGAVFCYSGFHPHMLLNQKYAYVRTQGQRVVAIQEKQPFTSSPMEELASCGAYYFRSGRILKDAVRWQIATEPPVDGEFYLSTAFNFLLNNDFTVEAYKIDKMIQLGTPHDYEVYSRWRDIFTMLATEQPKTLVAQLMVLMAGHGTRMKEIAAGKPKPFISLLDKPLYQWAKQNVTSQMPPLLVALSDHRLFLTQETNVLFLSDVTQGQAHSAFSALRGVREQTPFLVLPCDGIFMGAQPEGWLGNFDFVVWTAVATHEDKQTFSQFSWVDATDSNVRKIWFKPEAMPAHNEARLLTGAFGFRNKEIFQQLFNQLEGKNESYLDHLVAIALEKGFSVGEFVVPTFIPIGTSTQLKTFLFWEDVFKKDPTHPYGKRYQLSVVIPCYNEGHNVPELLSCLVSKALQEPDLQIVLVDNGSTDGSFHNIVVTEIPCNLQIVRFVHNRGYGAGIKYGLGFAAGEYIGWSHGDLQVDGDVLSQAKAITFQPGAQLIKGRRLGRGAFERLFTWSMSLVEAVIFFRWMDDIHGQPTFFPRELREQILRGAPDDFGLDLHVFVMSLRLRLKVTRFPMTFHQRKRGQSNWNTHLFSRARFGYRLFLKSLQLRFK